MGNKRYDARTDKNQTMIVRHINALPRHEVIDLSGVGGGCTDLLVQQKDKFGGVKFYLIEIKFEKGKLNKLQVAFHERFECHIVRNLDELWQVLGV